MTAIAILITLSVVAIAGTAATVRTTIRDGYRRVPTRR